MEKNTVFEKTYQHYLAEIRSINFLNKADLLQVERHGEVLVVPLFNRNFIVSAEDILAEDGSAADTVTRVIIAKYILTCNKFDEADNDPLMTYRDFKGSAPLISYFTNNAISVLESAFSGKGLILRQKCKEIGGVERDDHSYDCSFLFKALPRIPIVLNFNDVDDLFPATVSILYRASAEIFLDMECLAMTGTLLSDKLINNDENFE